MSHSEQISDGLLSQNICHLADIVNSELTAVPFIWSILTVSLPIADPVAINTQVLVTQELIVTAILPRGLLEICVIQTYRILIQSGPILTNILSLRLRLFTNLKFYWKETFWGFFFKYVHTTSNFIFPVITVVLSITALLQRYAPMCLFAREFSRSAIQIFYTCQIKWSSMNQRVWHGFLCVCFFFKFCYVHYRRRSDPNISVCLHTVHKNACWRALSIRKT